MVLEVEIIVESQKQCMLREMKTALYGYEKEPERVGPGEKSDERWLESRRELI